MNIGFIPARGGSRSIPLKNIKNFCGRPLIYWSLKALNNAKSIDQVYVATDSKKIKEVVNAFGFEKVKVYDRDPANAKDASSTESVILEFLEKNSFDGGDNFLLVQATSPMLSVNDIEGALLKYRKAKTDSLLTCAVFKRFLWTDKGAPLNYDFNNRPRRQDFKGFCIENGALYISKVRHIKKSRSRVSGKIGIYEMPEYSWVELDEPDDWMLAEWLMRKYVLKDDKKIKNVKLFLSDVDGTLTDAGMYYDNQGNELKKFNTQDGMGFKLLREKGIKTGLITSEKTSIVTKRAKKLKVDYLIQGAKDKLREVKRICDKERMSLDEVAYIGDDINCENLLKAVGVPGCPNNAVVSIKTIPGIIVSTKNGGDGAVREFIEKVL